MNLQLSKDSSFNKSFERENGYNLFLLGGNKMTSEANFLKNSTLSKNCSFNMPTNPYMKDHKASINLFVELADEGCKNDDYLNLNILQNNSSSVRPIIPRDASGLSNFSLNVNTGHNDFQNPATLHFKKDSTIKIEKEKSNEESTEDKTQYKPTTWGKKRKRACVDSAEQFVKNQEKIFGKTNYNWNQEVQFLLDEEKEEEKEERPKLLKPKRQCSIKKAAPVNVNIRRHRKKSKKQIDTLESHFDINVPFTQDLIDQLSEDLVLEKDQIYKWDWDKRKRLRRKAEKLSRSGSTKKNKRQKNH